MSNIVISVENLSKSYRLGQIGTGTLSRDLEVWWAKVRGKPNPLLKIGQTDHGNQDGQTLWALQDVSFQVQQGEVLGIIGRNGAGKSTLLKILSRVTAPTSGQVKVKGRIASLLEVGTGFHPELTGRENIFLNGAILGMSRQEVQRKFDEIVSFAEVEKFVDTPVKRYSSGMYVRLAFAVAAHLESEILLVDEVLAVGDAEFQKKCLGKMGDVATNEGRTVLFVSHNMASIKNICDTGLLLDSGMINFFGETEKTIDLYINKNKINSEIKLSQKKHYGSGEIKFSEIKFRSNGNYTNTINMGDDLEIEISYVVEIPIKNPIIGILFHDNLDQTIIRAYSRESNPSFPGILNKNGTIICRFEKFPLMNGQYNLRLWLGHLRNMVIDDVPFAAKVYVLKADVYTTGVLPDHNNGGVCFAPHSWEIK
jgi:lipopolysaccharide transport system ATP-binding protein